MSSDQILGALRLSGKSALTVALAALMLVFIGLLVVNFVGQVMQSARLESQRAALEVEVATMRAENGRLSGAVAFAESDVYVEQVARSELGYAREGDVVILPRVAAPTVAPDLVSAPAPAPAPALPPNWLRWWQAFFPAA
jgi:cell division protein FtsB